MTLASIHLLHNKRANALKLLSEYLHTVVRMTIISCSFHQFSYISKPWTQNKIKSYLHIWTSNIIESGSLPNRYNRLGNWTQITYSSNRIVSDSKSNTWFLTSNLERLLNTKTLCRKFGSFTDYRFLVTEIWKSRVFITF